MIIESEAIDLSMKKQVEQIRLGYGNETASHAFASLYIWQRTMNLSICLEEDFFAVKYGKRGSNAWFFPCGNIQKIRQFLSLAGGRGDLVLCYVQEQEVEYLENKFPGKFEIRECTGDSEYLYDRRQWESMKGRKFSGLRNHISRAKRDYFLRFELLREETMSDIFHIVRKWEQGVKREEGLNDREASEILMTYWEELEVQGVLVYVDEEPYAVVAGYPLSRETFDMSLAKQKSKLSGLTVYAKQCFIVSLPENYRTINAEEDLDVKGLRMMKHQMRPIGQVKMYEAKEVTVR